MAKKESAVELDQTLSLLNQNFFRELRKITEQRLKLEQETISAIKSDMVAKNRYDHKGRKVKSSVPKHFAVRLESSVGAKLAKSRGTADELEDKLQETRIAFEDKVKTINRMKNELDRRENVLVQSIQEIEVYIRAVFYLKQEADDMYVQLTEISKKQDKALKKLENECSALINKNDCIWKAITIFQPSKLFLDKMILGLPNYSSIQDLVKYYLILNNLQTQLLDREMAITLEQEGLVTTKQNLEEHDRRIPVIMLSKENTLLDLKSELKDHQYETTRLQEEIDLAILNKVKEDATWYDIQRWIKKLLLKSIEIRPLGFDEPTSGSLNMLDRLKDFTKDSLEIIERLKTKKDL